MVTVMQSNALQHKQVL